MNLNLSNSVRNQFIASLDDLYFIILQTKKPILDNAKPRICSKISDVMRSFVDLSPVSSESIQNDDSGVPNDLVVDMPMLKLELSREERLKVVSHLIDLKDFLLYRQTFDDKAKCSLITENRRIINQLLDLQQSDEESDQDLFKPSSKRQKEGEATLNETPDKLKEVTKKEVAKNREESGLQQGIENVSKARTEEAVSFKFELAGVVKFFNVDTNERHSDHFWCRDLELSVVMRLSVKRDHSKHLGLYLHCHNDDQLKVPRKVRCKLVLFSNLSPSKAWFDELESTIVKKTELGVPHFISYRELTDAEWGYIKGDKAVFGVELNVEPAINSSF